MLIAGSADLTVPGIAWDSLLCIVSDGDGEMTDLVMAAEKGVYQVWRDNASPTCQYGIFRNLEKILPKEETKKRINQVLEEIRDGSFLSDLSQEAGQGYKNLKAYDYENEESQITKTQNRLREILKYRHHK